MNTPGFGGYVVAIVLSWLAFLLILLLVTLPIELLEIRSGFGLAAIVWLASYVVIVGTPVGVVGATIVHLMCRHQPRQWVHVLAAGGAAVLIETSVALLAGAQAPQLLDPVVLLVLAPMTLAAMVGRAAVIPLVHTRAVHRPNERRAAHMRPF